MSLEEVLFIHNGYNYSEKENIYRDFFRLPINNLHSLEQFILRCKEYLQKQQDPFILYLHDISILMLIKESYFKEALAILEKTLILTKKYKLTAQMGVLYIRIGICQANLAIQTETDYLVKGLTILDVIEEHDLLEIMQVEVKKYSKSTENIGV